MKLKETDKVKQLTFVDPSLNDEEYNSYPTVLPFVKWLECVHALQHGMEFHGLHTVVRMVSVVYTIGKVRPKKLLTFLQGPVSSFLPTHYTLHMCNTTNKHINNIHI